MQLNDLSVVPFCYKISLHLRCLVEAIELALQSWDRHLDRLSLTPLVDLSFSLQSSTARKISDGGRSFYDVSAHSKKSNLLRRLLQNGHRKIAFVSARLDSFENSSKNQGTCHGKNLCICFKFLFKHFSLDSPVEGLRLLGLVTYV